MRIVAHISDLHFGRTDAAVVAALLAEFAAAPPHLVIISGDFTQGARTGEFRQAQAFLARLPAPWIAVPGNHDISPYHLVQRFFDPFRRYRRYIAAETEPVWHDDEIAIVGLNSARRMAMDLNWANGRFGRSQIARLGERLAALPKHLFRIVVAHHPLLPPPGTPELRVAGRAEEMLACCRSLDVGLALAGHLHRGYARFLEPVIDVPHLTDTHVRPPERAATRGLLVAQAASATSTRLRDEPNAYNRIRIEGGIAAIEPRIWTGTGFAPAERVAAVAVP